MRPVPGLCDRCGFRYDLSELRVEYVLGKPTNIKTCPECYDESHPQLDTRHIRTDDSQTVRGSRSDSSETTESRSYFGFNPVRGFGVTISNGRVTVT